jgi:hypothetical protein
MIELTRDELLAAITAACQPNVPVDSVQPNLTSNASRVTCARCLRALKRVVAELTPKTRRPVE